MKDFLNPVPREPMKPHRFLVMNLPVHLLRLQSAPTLRDAEMISIVPRTDVQWGGPIFRAPALPTPHQMGNELPFFVNFRSKPKLAKCPIDF